MEQDGLVEYHPTNDDLEATHRVLKYIKDKTEKKMNDKSRPLDWTFFFGISDALFVAWSMAAIPQHAWIVYMANAFVIFGFRFRNIMTPKSMFIAPGAPREKLVRLFYVFEFCYFANFFGVLVVIVLVCDPAFMTDRMADVLFCAGFGIACGPLLWAVVLFGNKFLFHDVDNTVSILIHLSPSLVMYSFRWKYEEIQAYWPYLFHRLSEEAFDRMSQQDLFISAAAFYMAWFFPYCTWLLFHGQSLPRNREFDLKCCRLNPRGETPYDTCFHFNMRDNFNGQFLIVRILKKSREELNRKRREHDFSKTEILIYSCGHAAIVLTLIPLSALCFHSKDLHGALVGLISLYAIYKGSLSYQKSIACNEEMERQVALFSIA